MAAGVIATVVNTTIIEESDFMVSQSESEVACGVFTLVTYVFVFGLLCLFGLIGNSLSFAVMRMDRRIHVAAFLLQVMAITDNAFLVTTGFSQIFTALLIYAGRLDHPVMPYMYKYIQPLVHITQLGTVWITVLVAFNRYIAICRPFRAPLLCTMNRVRLQVAIMFLLILLYNVPRFCEHRIEYVWQPETNWTQPTSEVTDLKKSDAYNIVYENALYCLFVFLGPLAILVVFNASLTRELLLAHRRQMARQLPPSRVKGEEQEQNITLVMVIIIVVFLVCQTPAYVNQVLSYVLGEEAYHCGKPYYYYFHVSNLVVSANSVFNFVIYCAFRKQFRQRLSTFCGRRGETNHRRSSSSVYQTGRCPGISIHRQQPNRSSIISDSISKSQPFQSLTSI